MTNGRTNEVKVLGAQEGVTNEVKVLGRQVARQTAVARSGTECLPRGAVCVSFRGGTSQQARCACRAFLPHLVLWELGAAVPEVLEVPLSESCCMIHNTHCAGGLAPLQCQAGAL